MKTLCERCTQGANGEAGHDDLEFYVSGPYPGHHIYNCTRCGDRWIRHCGLVERFGWTRYALQFPVRIPTTRTKFARKVPS